MGFSQKICWETPKNGHFTNTWAPEERPKEYAEGGATATWFISYRIPFFSLEYSSPEFRSEHDMIFAIPLGMR